LYASGDQGLPLLSRRSAAAVRAARLVYADIGRVVLERGADPLAARAVVSTWRKVCLAFRAAADTIFRVPGRFEPVALKGAVDFRDVLPV
jgi:phytoene synthase